MQVQGVSQIFHWLLMYSQSDFNKAKVESQADLKDSSVCVTERRMGVCVRVCGILSERQCLTRAALHTAAALHTLVCVRVGVCVFWIRCAAPSLQGFAL